MATRGWSFGALVNALKSAAFLNASTTPVTGEIPVVDSANNIVLPQSAVTGMHGLTIQNTYPDSVAAVVQNHSGTSASTPPNAFTSCLRLKWHGKVYENGVIRSADTNILGYGHAVDGVQRYTYLSSPGRHKMQGNVYAQSFTIGPSAPETTNGGTTWVSFNGAANNLNISVGGANYGFNSTGGITVPGAGTKDTAAVTATPWAGSWDDTWNNTAPALQVNLNNASASSIFRATLWGTSHVVRMAAAYTENKCAANLRVGGLNVWFDDVVHQNAFRVENASANAGIKAQGTIQSVFGNVQAGNAVFYQDGNLSGSRWGGGYLYDFMINTFVRGVQLSGRTVVEDTGGRIDVPSGCVYTGMSGSNYAPWLWGAYSQLQVLVGQNWVNVGGN